MSQQEIAQEIFLKVQENYTDAKKQIKENMEYQISIKRDWSQFPKTSTFWDGVSRCLEKKLNEYNILSELSINRILMSFDLSFTTLSVSLMNSQLTNRRLIISADYLDNFSLPGVYPIL